MSGKYKYKWKRFWVERGGETNLIDDGGFLYDPDAEYGEIFNEKTNSFESIQNVPCLVLLGEPGIGKSYSIKEAYENHTRKEGEEAFFLDLRSYGSEDRLFRKIFESREFSSWCNGNHTLHLFLDSLDECLLQIRTVSSLLVDELKQFPVKRLFFRIACRTAEWPSHLEEELLRLWGQDAVGVYQMAPLRRVDVIEAAKARDLDSESFLKEIVDREAQPLAIKPVTLKLLINLFHEVNQFPKTLSELYFKGCRLLCNEVNPNRRTAGFTGSLNDDQRLVIAARIAALTILANRYSISLEIDMGNIPEEDLSLKDLCGGCEEVFGERINVNEEVIKEVLSTGLFISRGPRRLGWAHQTFAEYLAAHYINTHNMAIPQIMSILTHPGADNGSLIPQLYETSAWLAGMNREVFHQIMEIDPDILLRSDVSTVDDCDRKKLVDYLFLLFNEERLVRYDHDREDYYKKLSHPELAAQLRPYLEENSEISVSAKRAAIKMAHKCEVKELLNTIAEIPFRDSELIEIRVAAAKAIAEIGDENSRRCLKPLALGKIDKDNEDQLKGYLLQAVWPIHITTEELLDVLTNPKNPNFMGSYADFLLDKLANGLDAENLVPLIEWSTMQIEHNTGIASIGVFRGLIESIIIKAWKYFGSGEIDDIFAILAFEFFGSDEYYCRANIPNTKLKKIIREDERKRLKLISHMFSILAETAQSNKITTLLLRISKAKIFCPEDVLWMIENILKTDSEKLQRIWGKAIRLVFPFENVNVKNRLLTVCAESRVAAELFPDYIDPIEFDSSEDKERRANHFEEEENKQKQKNAEPPLLEPSPKERIASRLKTFESGELSAWWNLIMEMGLEPRSTTYDKEFEIDITLLPGWIEADRETRERIIDAAKKYILDADPEKSKWFNRPIEYRIATAGYKAFFLLNKEEPDFISDLEPDIWKKWACVLISTKVYEKEKQRTAEELLERAYRNAPMEFISDLLEIIDYENQTDKNLSITGRIGTCWDKCIAEKLFQKLLEGNLYFKVKVSLLKLLIEHRYDKAEKYIESSILELVSKGEEKRDEVVNMAITLMNSPIDCGWPTIWPLFKNDPGLGMDIFSEVIQQHEKIQHKLLKVLSEEQLGDFFLWIVKQYPPHEDPLHRFGIMGVRQLIPFFRNQIISNLENIGTPSACNVLQRLAHALNEYDWLKWVLIKAQKNTLKRSWRPLTPGDILSIADNHQKRLVQNGEQLLEIIIDSLKRLEKKLHSETPANRDIWDKCPGTKKFRPIDENSFSDYVKRHLDDDLKGQGIVVNREVEINRGERTDILVDAIIKKENQESHCEKISVIIELKGCWHKGIRSAMKNQLMERYLKENTCRHGLYLVGWFNCELWDDKDPRKNSSPKKTKEQAQKEFEEQAFKLSTSDAGVTIKALVLNTSLKR